MANVNVVYNERQEPLEVLLQTIDRPGDYCMQDRLLVPMPRVDVEGAHALSFPITESQAGSLAAAAEPAPYGRGEQTLLDRSVRACGQIDAARVRISGGAWHDTLAQVVTRAATGLGCPPEHTFAHLYKLLVYEPGGFFAPHRDTEKVDGMVATLVVSLPVAGAGGELVVRHRERKTVVDLRTEEPSKLAFAAFYADCLHEIRPVTAGDKLVWLLEHRYSEAGLSFDVLKNADAAVGRVLVRAAQRADHVLYAAILSIYEWATLDDLGDFSDWNEPRDDWEDLAEDEIVSTRQLLGLVASDGARPDYGALPLLPGELLPACALDGVAPDDDDFTYTGNEGVQVSRSYRRAALVLWPRERTVGTLARGGIERAVAWFADDLARCEDDTGSRRRLAGLAAQLIDAWPAPDSARFFRRSDEDNGVQRSCQDALRLLRRFGDETTTKRFLCEVATPHYSGAENDELLATAAALSRATLRAWLPGFTAANLRYAPEEVLDLLWHLCPRHDTPADLDRLRRPALAAAARAACRSLPEAVNTEVYGVHARFSLSAQAIRSLFALVWYCAPATDADAAAAVLVQHPPTAPPGRALPQALGELAQLRDAIGDAIEPAGFATLWRHAASFLLARSATPPEEPRDWVIEARIPCDCEHCARLRAFCADPTATTVRFRMQEKLRAHVASMITFRKLDIDCKTERTGRPHTLICIKNRATYEDRCAQYAEDLAYMRLLVAAAPRGEATTDAADLRILHDLELADRSQVDGR